MHYLSELKRIITAKKKALRDKQATKLFGVGELYDLTVGLATVLRLAIKESDDRDTDRLERGHVAFTKFINWTVMEYTRQSNKKYLQLIPVLLREKHQLSPGALISTINKTSFMEKDTTKQVLTIEPDVILLYLGVETDQEYDTIALKMLAEDKILYYHKRESLPWFIDNLSNHFKIIQKAKIDQT